MWWIQAFKADDVTLRGAECAEGDDGGPHLVDAEREFQEECGGLSQEGDEVAVGVLSLVDDEGENALVAEKSFDDSGDFCGVVFFQMGISAEGAEVPGECFVREGVGEEVDV